MDKSKIALVTCYFQPNYGSQLQAYATQKILDDLGVENETICIDGVLPEINKAKYKYFLSRIWHIHTVKDKFAVITKKIAGKTRGEAYRKNISIRNKMFADFSSTIFRLSETFKSKNELNQHAHEYKAFLVGSDQLWLPSNIAADYYTLNFVPDDIPKIAYATSFGISQLPKFQHNKAKLFLNRINYLSVREKSGQQIVSNITGKTVPIVCDPTLLFTAQEWEHIQSPNRIISEKYILCYFLGNNPKQREFVKQVKEQTGHKIVQLQHLDEYIASDNSFPDFAPYNIGPSEYISLIRDAEIVCVDSFHGTVFSILYKKTFFSFNRYRNESSVSTNTRIYSFLDLLGLKDRYYSVNIPNIDDIYKEIDYEKVHKKLDDFRKKSLHFLQTSFQEIGI